MHRAILICRGHLMAAAVLRGWLETGNEVAEIWATAQEDTARSQRTMSLWAPQWSVPALARRHGIPIFVNPPLRGWREAGERVAALRADTLISAVTMQIIPPAILDLFGGRAVNFHPALLPAYRGPSPFLGMLLDAQESISGGVTLHQLTPGIDEGPVIAQIRVPFNAVGGTYQRWLVANAVACRQLTRDALPAWLDGSVHPIPQRDGSYRRVVEEAVIDASAAATDARHRLERIGRTGRLGAAFRGAPKPVPVRAIDQVLGPPTGAPPTLTTRFVSLDVADARLRLRRWTIVDDGLQRLETIRAVRRAQAQE